MKKIVITAAISLLSFAANAQSFGVRPAAPAAAPVAAPAPVAPAQAVEPRPAPAPAAESTPAPSPKAAPAQRSARNSRPCAGLKSADAVFQCNVKQGG